MKLNFKVHISIGFKKVLSKKNHCSMISKYFDITLQWFFYSRLLKPVQGRWLCFQRPIFFQVDHRYLFLFTQELFLYFLEQDVVERCLQPSRRGLCKALLKYWYYNADRQACEEFTYGGCEAGSSPNKFRTKALCEATCGGVTRHLGAWGSTFFLQKKFHVFVSFFMRDQLSNLFYILTTFLVLTYKLCLIYENIYMYIYIQNLHVW